MNLEDFTPDPTALTSAELDHLLAQSQVPLCEEYVPAVSSAFLAEPAGELKAALGLLLFVVGLRLDAEDPLGPLRAEGWFTSIRPDALSAEQGSTLEAWLPLVDDAELSARLLDTLWLSRKGSTPAHLHGRSAIEKYLQSLKRFATAYPQRSAIRNRLRRAIRLENTFKQEPLVKTFAVQLLAEQGDHRPSFLDVELLEFLLDYRVGSPDEWLERSEALAAVAEERLRAGTWGQPGPDLAHELWSLAGRFADRKAENESSGQAQRLKSAEMFAIEAVHASGAGDLRVAAQFYSEAALEAQGQGNPARVEEWVAKSREAQMAAPSVQFATELDVAEEAERARKSVSGKSIFEAIGILAHIVNPPPIAVLRDMSIQHLEICTVERILATQTVSLEGRVESINSPPEPGEFDSPAFRHQMRKSAVWLRGTAYGFIAGATQQIIVEHNVQMRDILALAHRSPLVPPGHEHLFAQGLLAGFRCDFVSACHILIPQLENGLRHYSEFVLGRTLDRMKSDGKQMAGMLDKVLSLPELEDVLGADMIFDLRGLLVEHDSVNLRNRLSHGLANDGDFGTVAVYTWWLCLRVAFAVMGKVRRNKTQETDLEP